MIIFFFTYYNNPIQSDRLSKIKKDNEIIDELNRISDREIENNRIKTEQVDIDRDREIIYNINNKINYLETINMENERIIKESNYRNNKLIAINNNLDIIIALRKDKEYELSNTNNLLDCVIEENQKRIDKMTHANINMDNIIRLNNQEMDSIIAQYKKMTDLSKNAVVSFPYLLNNSSNQTITNVLGNDIISGMNKEIYPDSSSILLKCNVNQCDDYYVPVYKVKEMTV